MQFAHSRSIGAHNPTRVNVYLPLCGGAAARRFTKLLEENRYADRRDVEGKSGVYIHQ
jgi:hypothetical protein